MFGASSSGRIMESNILLNLAVKLCCVNKKTPATSKQLDSCGVFNWEAAGKCAIRDIAS